MFRFEKFCGKTMLCPTYDRRQKIRLRVVRNVLNLSTLHFIFNAEPYSFG